MIPIRNEDFDASDLPLRTCMVVHAGALGDFVFLWPLLRALIGLNWRVRIVTTSSRGRLVKESQAVEWEDAESPRWNNMWVPQSDAPSNSPPDSASTFGIAPAATPTSPHTLPSPPIDLVLNFVADDTTEGGRTWFCNARRLMPTAEVRSVGPPGSASRQQVWERFGVLARCDVPRRDNPDGPIIAHVGAGSRQKQWPINRWADWATSLRAAGHKVEVIAGEVEAERMDTADRAAFDHLHGRVIWNLTELASAAKHARLFVGADTGPVHLACQLGVPTLGLYGPTDPRVWSTTGGRFCALAPVPPQSSSPSQPSGTSFRPSPMTWLSVDAVLAQTRTMLQSFGQ